MVAQFTAGIWDSSGMRTNTVVPAPGVDSISIVPFARITRSCIPNKPKNAGKGVESISLNVVSSRALNEKVFPFFLTTKIPAGLAGIFMAALYSAAMSTMSSDLNCLSAVGVEDYYRKLRPGSTDRQRLFGADEDAACAYVGTVARDKLIQTRTLELDPECDRIAF